MHNSYHNKKKYTIVSGYLIHDQETGPNTKILLTVNPPLALKIYERNNTSFQDIKIRYLRIRNNISHLNILKYKDYQQCVLSRYRINQEIKEDQINIVLMQRMIKQNLAQIIRKNTKLIDQKIVRALFSQMLSAIKHLHSQYIFHENINPYNIMFDSDYVLKVGGLLKAQEKFQKRKLKPPVNLVYYAPQTLKANNYDKASADIYALGIILYLLAYKLDPISYFLKKQKNNKNIGKHLSILSKQKFKLNEQLNDLIDKMTEFNPTQRYTLDKIENHVWFKKQIASSEELKKFFMEQLKKQPKVEFRSLILGNHHRGIQQNSQIQIIMNSIVLDETEYPQKLQPTNEYYWINGKQLLKVATVFKYRLEKAQNFLFPQQFQISQQYSLECYKSAMCINCKIGELNVQIKLHMSVINNNSQFLVQFEISDSNEDTQGYSQWLLRCLLNKWKDLTGEYSQN